jgi:hypothetical protein
MNLLLYTTAFGHPVFRKMAENLMRTARACGFGGDTLIVGDAHCLPGMPKAGLLRALDREKIESYDKVLFMDSDCIFVRDPAPMFANEGLSLVIGGNALNFYNSIFLSREEKRYTGGRVHSGAFLMPGKEAWSFLSAWEGLWLDAPREQVRKHPDLTWVPEGMMDQAALQALVIRSGLAYQPLQGMRFPLVKKDWRGNAVVLHFCGDLRQGSHLGNKDAVWKMISTFDTGPASSRLQEGE